LRCASRDHHMPWHTILRTTGWVLAVIAGIWLYARLERWWRDARLRKALGERPRLSDEQFCLAYPVATGVEPDVVRRVRAVVEEVLQVDMSQLRPEDRFTCELAACYGYDSLADVKLVGETEREFGITITDDEAVACKSVGDLVLLVDRKLRERASHGANRPA